MRRRRREPMPAKFWPLATYNGECWRGVVHTPEMDQRMAALQAEFDAWQEARLRAEPGVVFLGGTVDQ